MHWKSRILCPRPEPTNPSSSAIECKNCDRIILDPVAFAPPPVSSEKTIRLLRLTSGGHVPGFGQSTMDVASRDHILKVDFHGARSAHPVAEDYDCPDAGSGPPGIARPLGRITYPEVWDGVSEVYEKSGMGIVKSTTVYDGKNAPFITQQKHGGKEQ